MRAGRSRLGSTICDLPLSGPLEETISMKRIFISLFFSGLFWPAFAEAGPFEERLKALWPKTDFSKSSISLRELRDGGPGKDGIPSIDDPTFRPNNKEQSLSPTEPVIGLIVNGDARAYPLRILTWHEIVNDVVGGHPVAVTYCPLCNSAVVFDRRLEGRELTFGVSGMLRNSDMVMYDRQTESLWQQFLGEGIVGEMLGKTLKTLPARLESFAEFQKRAPFGKVLIAPSFTLRDYGRNPYVGYDTGQMGLLYDGDLPNNIHPLVRVVTVGKKAWALPKLRKGGEIKDGDILLTWRAGQNSALDTRRIDQGRDVGSVVVQRRDAGGTYRDIPYDVTFAFVFHAFHPDGELIQ